ncbi:hypothetical protein N9V88_01550, partial [bacterium]|nr:hypothetical protein [bacterium]
TTTSLVKNWRGQKPAKAGNGLKDTKARDAGGNEFPSSASWGSQTELWTTCCDTSPKQRRQI